MAEPLKDTGFSRNIAIPKKSTNLEGATVAEKSFSRHVGAHRHVVVQVAK